jgi:hypothetical protein
MKNEQYLPLYLFWLIIVFLTLTSSVITAFIVGAIIQKRVIARIGKFLNLNTIDPIEQHGIGILQDMKLFRYWSH